MDKTFISVIFISLVLFVYHMVTAYWRFELKMLELDSKKPDYKPPILYLLSDGRFLDIKGTDEYRRAVRSERVLCINPKDNGFDSITAVTLQIHKYEGKGDPGADGDDS